MGTLGWWILWGWRAWGHAAIGDAGLGGSGSGTAHSQHLHCCVCSPVLPIPNAPPAPVLDFPTLHSHCFQSPFPFLPVPIPDSPILHPQYSLSPFPVPRSQRSPPAFPMPPLPPTHMEAICGWFSPFEGLCSPQPHCCVVTAGCGGSGGGGAGGVPSPWDGDVSILGSMSCELCATQTRGVGAKSPPKVHGIRAETPPPSCHILGQVKERWGWGEGGSGREGQRRGGRGMN